MTTLTVTLADQVNEQIALAERCLRTAVEHAWNAGRLLNGQKRSLTHGEWLPWLSDNVNLSARRAQEWMDLAGAYTRAPAHLSIEDALKEARHERRMSAGEMAGVFAGTQENPVAVGFPPESDGIPAPAARPGSERKDRRAAELLDDASEHYHLAHKPGLSNVAVARAYRDGAIACQHAATLLDELAIAHER